MRALPSASQQGCLRGRRGLRSGHIPPVGAATDAAGSAGPLRCVRCGPKTSRQLSSSWERIGPEDLRLRFFHSVKDFSHQFVARLTQLDYARAMAFAALDIETGEIMGVARLHSDSRYESAEYAILIRSDLKGKGLGWALMQLLIDYASAEGLKSLCGQVLAENTTMLAMCRELGFSVKADPNDAGLALVWLDLTSRMGAGDNASLLRQAVR